MEKSNIIKIILKSLKSKCCYLFALLLLTSAEELVAQQSNIQQFNLQNGLPQSQVSAITHSLNGYLWVGTNGGGLCRYDGKAFQYYNSKTGLQSDFIYSIYGAENNIVYIGSGKGVDVINHTDPPRKIAFEDNQFHVVTAMVKYNDILYIGTKKGCYIHNTKINDKAKKIENLVSNAEIHKLVVINKELWIGASSGLFLFNGKSIRKSNFAYHPNVIDIVQDGDNVWFAMMDYGITLYATKSNKVLNTITDASIQKTKSMCILNNDELLFGTLQNGIFKYNKKSNELSSFNKNTQKLRLIQTLYKDYWQNVWIGTSGNGLLKSSNQRFQYIDPEENGFYNSKIFGLTKSKNGSIYLYAGLNEIKSFENNNFKNIEDFPFNVKIKSIGVDTLKNIWIGTEGKGLIQFDKGHYYIYNYSTGNFPDDFIQQVAIDTVQNVVWIATRSSGLVKIKNGSQIRLTKKDSIKDEHIVSIHLDKKNNLWYGTKSGQIGCVMQNDKVKNYDFLFAPNSIKCIATDSNDDLYIGATDYGIYKLIGDQFTKIESESGYSNNIYSMVIDRDDAIWIGSANGAFRLKKKDEKTNKYVVEFFGENDGFYGKECCSNAATLDGFGNVWFGTLNGISIYKNQSDTREYTAPILHLDQINLFYKPINTTSYFKSYVASKRIDLPYTENHISFNFQAIHFNQGDDIKYRYKLHADDAQWSQWSDEKSVHFASLKPDNYNFIVQAGINASNLSNTVSVPFVIQPPFWQSMWFRIFTFLIGGLAIAMIFRIREKNIRKKANDLELQNQLLNLEQKALRLQMNPHFIFNALNSIQSVVVENDVEKAREQIQNFALLIRSILNNSRKKDVLIKDELQTIEKYLQLEQFCQKNKFNFTVDIDPSIQVDEAEIPSMIVQPYVENAVIHGVAHLNRPGTIAITFKKLNEQYIEVLIHDNGIGRKKAREMSLEKSKSHVSLGMEVTRQRLKKLVIDGESEAEIITDLEDENGLACGTLVKLKIPYYLPY